MRQRAHELVEKINALAGLSSFPNLSKLELDLFQQHLRDLYALIDNAKNADKAVAPLVQHKVTTVTKETTTEKKPAPQIVIEEQPMIVQKEETPALVNQVVAETVNPTLVNTIPPVQEVPVVEAPPVRVQKVGEQKTINERVSGTGSLNEKWKNDTAELHQKIAGKQLKELLDLNKRIAITSELFKGSSEQFGAAIAELDGSVNFESAEVLFNQLAEKNNWSADSQAVRLLHKLLRQKFGL